MKSRRRVMGTFLVGLLGLAPLLGACGAHGAKAPATDAFQGPLPPLGAVQFATPSVGYAGGQGIVLATSDGGATWRRIYRGSAMVRALDFVGATEGWILTETGAVLRWNGRTTWQRVAPSLGPIAGMHLFPDGHAVVLTAQGKLYRAESPAGPWQAEPLQGVRAFSLSGAGTGFAVSYEGGLPEVYVTSDGGETWSLSFSPKVTQDHGWTATIASSGTSAWLLLTRSGGQMEHAPYVVYRTSDRGRHWAELLAAPLFASEGVYPAAPDSLYGVQAGPFAAGGAQGYFLSWSPGNPRDLLALDATSNGGATWQQRVLRSLPASDTPDFFSPLGIWAVQPATLWLAGSQGGHGLLLVSRDGGQTWTRLAL